MPTPRRRAVPEEEHDNHERWLITYADMITLLMVLFIVLFAISQVDQKRFEMLKDGMAAGFGHSSSPFQGSQAVMPEPGTQPIAPFDPMDATAERPVDVQQVSQRTPESDLADRYAKAVAEVNRLDGLRRRIDRALEKHGLREDVRMKIDSRGLTISLVSRHIVFDPNVADLTPRGRRVLDVISPILDEIPDQLDIDGHTNQEKVKPKYYATDWDLSSARAVTVLRYLNERRGIDGSRLSAVAFGNEKPLIDPADPRAKVLNKRVDVVVVSGADDATRALFETVLRERDRT
ncbi:MAG TPA: flagellar motor protein MotB [Nocardioidaceae bacterium]|nr:flagellar motor protein MotB [Nocardioidaceae bacterium]